MSSTNGKDNIRLSCFIRAFDEAFDDPFQFLFRFLKYGQFFSRIQYENRQPFTIGHQLFIQDLLVESPGFPHEAFDAIAVYRPFK